MWYCKPYLVYPPCGLQNLTLKSISKRERKKYLVAVAQFRPEKNHKLMVGVLNNLVNNHPDLCTNLKLVLIGGVRNDEDLYRVEELKKMIANKKLNVLLLLYF